jgi:hypothetical protein
MNNKNYGYFYHGNNSAFPLGNVYSTITASGRKAKSSFPLLNPESSYHLSL